MAKEIRCRAGSRRSRHLPIELQEEILVRLPVKSVCRFESVCKTWRSKFRSRPFINLYGIRQRDDSKYSLDFHMACSCKSYLMKIAPGLFDMLLPRKTNTGGCWRRVRCVFGPLSNGIYCLTSHISDKSKDHFSILSGRIALCNPSIRDYKATNLFPSDLCSQLSDKIASKPCRAHFGFGKINSSLDYKVVVLIQYGEPLSSFISLVYSLQSGEWKKIVGGNFNVQGRRIIDICYPLEVCPQRFLQGCWHWIARGEDLSFNVLSFNFADEAFKLIRGPPDHIQYYRKLSVFTLHDHLAVIICYSVLPPPCVVEVDVWMMMEYGVEESWTRIYKINPNFNGEFLRLLGIEYHPLRDEESGSIRIKSLSFSDVNEHTIQCDDVGYQVRGLFQSRMTPEISTYIETLERLQILLD